MDFFFKDISNLKLKTLRLIEDVDLYVWGSNLISISPRYGALLYSSWMSIDTMC